MKKIIFLDLDGTIIETVSGKTFPTFIGDMKFKDGILNALENFIKLNNTIALFVVTNQGGIEKGTVTEYEICTRLGFIISSLGDYFRYKLITFYEYCKTCDPQDKYRKPNVGMLEKCVENYIPEHLSIQKEQMLMIGDASGLEGQFSDSDKKTAENFGIDYIDVSKFIETYKQQQ